MEAYRTVLLSFEKIRRPIQEVFGIRWISFYQVLNAIFEKCLENAGKLKIRLS